MWYILPFAPLYFLAEVGLSMETFEKRRGKAREVISGPCCSTSLETTMMSTSAPPTALFDKDRLWKSSSVEAAVRSHFEEAHAGGKSRSYFVE
jgi:hypothetical protein